MYNVSICMPYFERMERLEVTLGSFKNCGYFKKGKVEVSICDDGSIREPIPKEWLSREDIPFNISWLKKKKKWMNACVPLNKSVRQTESELVLLQSPETYHVTPVIEKLAAGIKNYKDIMLACVAAEGQKKVFLPFNRGVLKHVWYSHPTASKKRYWFCTMMTRRLFDEVGGLDERYRHGLDYEDNDFEDRLIKAGANYKWDEDCLAIHMWKPEDGEDRPESRINREIYKSGK